MTSKVDEKESKELFEHMKNVLSGKVKDVRASKRLKELSSMFIK